jgi:hypothetical protein
MTAAKYKGSSFFIPLHGTAARKISVRHLYSSVLSNLTVLGTSSLLPGKLNLLHEKALTTIYFPTIKKKR